jgi:hypothetical protein
VPTGRVGAAPVRPVRPGLRSRIGSSGPRRQLWAWVTAVVVPVLGLVVARPAHYPNDFDTLGHLGLIYADTVLFVVGALLAFTALRSSPA